MKFIHCADLHLNSPLTTKLSPKKAERIKQEAFFAFERLINNAKINNISVVVIAGDLFDGNEINPSASFRLKQMVESAREIKFIFVYGNHDYNPTQNPFKDFPKNFICLEKNQSVLVEDTLFTAYSESLSPLAQDYYNVVIGHGDESTVPKIDFSNLTSKTNLNQLNITLYDYDEDANVNEDEANFEVTMTAGKFVKLINSFATHIDQQLTVGNYEDRIVRREAKREKSKSLEQPMVS